MEVLNRKHEDEDLTDGATENRLELFWGGKVGGVLLSELTPSQSEWKSMSPEGVSKADKSIHISNIFRNQKVITRTSKHRHG